MPRSFNTAGPCRPDTDYMLPPSARLPGVVDLIDQQKYFVLHAPRQAGKTTAFRALATELTESGRYVAELLSMEVGAAFPDDPGAAEGASRGWSTRWHGRRSRSWCRTGPSRSPTPPSTRPRRS